MLEPSLVRCLRKTNRTVCLLSYLFFLFNAYPFAQSSDPAGLTSSSQVITGRPFSAVKFTRSVHIGRDGTAVTVAERTHSLVARDVDGQIFMADTDESGNRSCDLPGTGTLPVCGFWHVLIFDPTRGIMWHWLDGVRAAEDQYVEVKLSDNQTGDAQRLTIAPPLPRIEQPTASVSMQDLGEQNIEGIPARGLRIVTLHNDTTRNPKITIHEVWTSTQMCLVLRIVDGDPEGDETISGLDHISLASSRILFQLPSERILRSWKNNSSYADSDLARLANWLVR